VRGSLGPPPESWTQRDRVLRGNRITMGLGLYCSPECLVAALPRVSALVCDLDRGGIGLHPLAPDDEPPVLPPPVTKGGIE